MVSVGFGTGFVIIEAGGGISMSESTPALTSSCRCLVPSPLGSVGEEPVSAILAFSWLSRCGFSESVLDSGGVKSGTKVVTGKVGQTNVSLRERRTVSL